LIFDSCDANSLPGPSCGPSKTGSSICQGHVGLNRHQTPNPFDIISGGSKGSSASSGGLLQDAKSSASLSTFPFTDRNSQVEKDQMMQENMIDPTGANA